MCRPVLELERIGLEIVQLHIALTPFDVQRVAFPERRPVVRSLDLEKELSSG